MILACPDTLKDAIGNLFQIDEDAPIQRGWEFTALNGVRHRLTERYPDREGLWFAEPVPAGQTP